MRVIVTGGSGLIGRPLIRSLKREGFEVIVLSRNPKNHDLTAGVHVHQWDAKTSQGWGHLVREDSIIINLAGENPAQQWTEANKQAILQSRLDAAHAIQQAIEESLHPPAALMQASAVGYYGTQGDTILTEESALGDTWLADVCHQWEAAVQPIADKGVRTCWLRLGIVLDPEGGALPSFLQAAGLMTRRLGGGEQWIPWIHCEDVSHMIRYLMLHERSEGVYNLCAPNPVTNSQLLETIASIKQNPSLVPVPQWMLKLVMGEMASTVLQSQRVIPQRLQQEGYDFQFSKIEDALKQLVA